ncbi:hypothetical protein D3OALGB2SA_903 [Olavius algarvensis associated proteobacterium Delta 3]|nr:hypothetical protein D3OALGB2SA_903 [Olavius algarvensis associated proteobacterium Delta 3]
MPGTGSPVKIQERQDKKSRSRALLFYFHYYRSYPLIS